MKILFAALFYILPLQKADKLANSVWTHKITDGCVSKLIFQPGGQVVEYDCSLGSSVLLTYSIENDILIIKEKDRTDDDDKKTADMRITKYLLKNYTLYLVEKSKLTNGKWERWKIPPGKKPDYIRNK